MSEFNQRYRDLTDTSAKLAAMLQQHLIKRAPYSSLRINPKTVKITGKLSSDLILTWVYFQASTCLQITKQMY